MSTAHRNFTSLTNLIKKFVVLDHKFTTVFRAGIIQKQPSELLHNKSYS